MLADSINAMKDILANDKKTAEFTINIGNERQIEEQLN